MTRPQRISYVFMAVMLLFVGWLHMATLLLTTMFGYLALRTLAARTNKVVAATLFTVLIVGVSFGALYFGKRAYVAFPQLADVTIPKINELLSKVEVELPFKGHEGLMEFLKGKAQLQFRNIQQFLTTVVFQLVYLIIGAVVAVSLFFNSRLDLHADPSVKRDSLYALSAQEIMRRFAIFYGSFRIVMGAQILISMINSVATGIFLFAADFPHAAVLTMFTFLCGLLPIVGNLISNVVITCVGLIISPNMAMLALGYLVVVHKFEYFLNSKIIGGRIKNPMWLTLIGLLIGERLMGIPGMILAPVVLHYIKVEASKAKAEASGQVAAVESAEADNGEKGA
jgi:predicted PurR-regulated permease PerM